MSKPKIATKVLAAIKRRKKKGTGFIVMSNCTALVPYKGSPSLMLMISVLQGKVNDLEELFRLRLGEIEYLHRDVPRVTQHLALEMSDKITSINVLYEEIERLDKGDLSVPDRNKCAYREETEEEIRKRTILNNEQGLVEQQAMKKKPARVKLLFKKITAYAHPSKDSDPNLKDFYVEAKNNYEQSNALALESLFKYLQQYLWARRIPEELAKFLASRKIKLESVVESVMQERKRLEQDPRIMIAIAFRSGDRLKAQHLYAELLEKNEAELKQQRDYLLSMLGLTPDRRPILQPDVVSTVTVTLPTGAKLSRN